jgi:hypothetical protein
MLSGNSSAKFYTQQTINLSYSRGEGGRKRGDKANFRNAYFHSHFYAAKKSFPRETID